MTTPKITIIGGGNMGAAFVESLLRNEHYAPSEILVIDQNASKRGFFKSHNLNVAQRCEEVASGVLVLAVKPQQLRETLKGTTCSKDIKLVISTIAGASTQTLCELTGIKEVVRCMPNLGVASGCGVTGYFPAPSCSEEGKALFDKLFENTGLLFSFPSEEHIDATTAVSATGPAYFFAVFHALSEAAEELGIAPDISKEMILSTAESAISLARSTEASMHELIEQVKSNKGTTVEAFKVLETAKTEKAFNEAVKAAFLRSQSLGKEI